MEQPLTRLSLYRDRCMLRVLDSFGTEPEFNHAHYAQSKGHKTPWGKWNLNPQQFNTMFRKSAECQHTLFAEVRPSTITKGLVSFSSLTLKNQAIWLNYGLCAGFQKQFM